MLVKSLSTVPLLWCSWRELARLCEDREMVREGKGSDEGGVGED